MRAFLGATGVAVVVLSAAACASPTPLASEPYHAIEQAFVMGSAPGQELVRVSVQWQEPVNLKGGKLTFLLDQPGHGPQPATLLSEARGGPQLLQPAPDQLAFRGSSVRVTEWIKVPRGEGGHGVVEFSLQRTDGTTATSNINF